MHHLLGTTEIAGLLGSTRQRVFQLTREPGSPEPVAVLRGGHVWETEYITAWAKANGREIVEDE